MMFKQPKENLIASINSVVWSATNSQLGGLQNAPVHNYQYIIQSAIVAAVTEAMKELVENIYTDTEFEQDLGLK